MPRPLQGCPIYSFKPRITYRNDLLLPTSLYGINVPSGLSDYSVRAPTFVSREDMKEIRKSDPIQEGQPLKTVHGYVSPDFSLRFSNFWLQWQQVSTQITRSWWQFRGGDVYLDLAIQVYVLKDYSPRPNDAIYNQIFALIMEHELWHVEDAIKIITQWMPSMAYQDQNVQKYFTHAEIMGDEQFKYWFHNGYFEKYLRDCLYEELSKQAKVRHSSAECKKNLLQIETLLIKLVNQPSRP